MDVRLTAAAVGSAIVVLAIGSADDALACSPRVLGSFEYSAPAAGLTGVPVNAGLFLDANGLRPPAFDPFFAIRAGSSSTATIAHAVELPGIMHVDLPTLPPGEEIRVRAFTSPENTRPLELRFTTGSTADDRPPDGVEISELSVKYRGAGDSCSYEEHYSVRVEHEPSRDDTGIAAYLLEEQTADGSFVPKGGLVPAPFYSALGTSYPAADGGERCFRVTAIDLAGNRSDSRAVRCVTLACGCSVAHAPRDPRQPLVLLLLLGLLVRRVRPTRRSA